jgi:hypothetical protein
MSRPVALTACALLLFGCPPGDDDDDDASTCVGTMTWTVDSTAGEGGDGMTCALSQGPTFITINTDSGDGTDWQITFSEFEGEGTWDIVPYGNWNITGHHGGESWWATDGIFIVDTWADPSLAGSFDVTGANADDSATFAVSGTFDVTVAEYQE